jgi:hypothetical protein
MVQSRPLLGSLLKILSLESALLIRQHISHASVKLVDLLTLYDSDELLSKSSNRVSQTSFFCLSDECLVS